MDEQTHETLRKTVTLYDDQKPLLGTEGKASVLFISSMFLLAYSAFRIRSRRR